MSCISTQNSNTTLTSMINYLQFIKEEYLIYLPLIFIIFGLIGFLGNAFTFLQSTLRYNSCCIYLLCESFIDITNLLINLSSIYRNGSSENLLPKIVNRYHCKLKLFSLVFLPQLSINFLILSVIDRYACTCSMTSSIRYIRRLSTIPWIIFCTTILTSLMSLYSPVFYDVKPGEGCTCTDPFLNGILYIIIHGFLTPCILLLYVLLTYRNVINSRHRANLTNRDRSRNPFVQMIFTQVLTTSFLTLQWIIFYIYHIFTIHKMKSCEQRTLHFFLWFISNSIYYLINVKSFYLSTLTSRLFRKTLIESIHRLLPICQSRTKNSINFNEISKK
ncbi:hypothetical protein I4U23_017780 [Adineta vaga]|nr:hypothetical protein I4U23_017780 [Adineta vaga]